jgi:hypothetical protein
VGVAVLAAVIGQMLHMAVDIFNSRTQVQMLWLMIGFAAASYRLSILKIKQQGSIHVR